MCGRYVLLQHHHRAVLRALGIEAPANVASRFNIAPGSAVPAVRIARSTKGFEATSLHWGLIPSWAKEIGSGSQFANARAESIAEKPAFREAVRRRRCILPATGFYEWNRSGGRGLPWLFRRPDDRPFALAGIWEAWNAPGRAPFETCAIVTTRANAAMAPIHHRMPVLLTSESSRRWLEAERVEVDELGPLFQPPPENFVYASAVSRRVNDARNDDEFCIQPPDMDEPVERDGPQLTLEL